MSDENEYLSKEEIEEIDNKNRKKSEIYLISAKKEAARIGKEPFDLDIMVSYMEYAPPAEDIKKYRESMTKEWEFLYYADKRIMTLEEFAEALDRCEEQGG